MILSNTMSMSSCKSCLENQWTYHVTEDWIYATCKFCNNEVIFPKRKPSLEERKEMNEDTPCRKCNGQIVLQERKPLSHKQIRKLTSGEQKYYFTHYYICLQCKEMYYSEKFKKYYERN